MVKTQQIVLWTVGAAAVLLGILAALGTGGLALATGVPELLILGGFSTLGIGAGV